MGSKTQGRTTIHRSCCSFSAADSAQLSAQTAAEQAKVGASAAASELKEGITGDKALSHAVVDAGTEARRAADDVATEAERGAEDAKPRTAWKMAPCWTRPVHTWNRRAPISHVLWRMLTKRQSVPRKTRIPKPLELRMSEP